MIRVTADSNINISPLQFRGKPQVILELAANKRVSLIGSPPILDEVQRVLRDKFRWPSERLQQALRVMQRLMTIVQPSVTIDAVPADRDDNRILEFAVEGRCDYIITGDKDLLRLGAYEGIHILTATQLLDDFKRHQSP